MLHTYSLRAFLPKLNAVLILTLCTVLTREAFAGSQTLTEEQRRKIREGMEVRRGGSGTLTADEKELLRKAMEVRRGGSQRLSEEEKRKAREAFEARRGGSQRLTADEKERARKALEAKRGGPTTLTAEEKREFREAMEEIQGSSQTLSADKKERMREALEEIQGGPTTLSEEQKRKLRNAYEARGGGRTTLTEEKKTKLREAYEDIKNAPPGTATRNSTVAGSPLPGVICQDGSFLFADRPGVCSDKGGVKITGISYWTARWLQDNLHMHGQPHPKDIPLPVAVPVASSVKTSKPKEHPGDRLFGKLAIFFAGIAGGFAIGSAFRRPSGIERQKYEELKEKYERLQQAWEKEFEEPETEEEPRSLPPPMTEKRKRIIIKILIVKAIAKDRAGTPEGKTAAKIAQEMMRKHKITEEELEYLT